jgi:hypothetical protein
MPRPGRPGGSPLQKNMKTSFSQKKIIAVFLICVLSILCILGCSRKKEETESVSQVLAQKLYLRSQQQLAKGEYEEAYNDYQRAVEADPGASDMSHLSSILYAWVISESEGDDVPHLDAQKRVWLEPDQLGLRRRLLSLALDAEKGTIQAFGIGLAPGNISNDAQKRFLSRKAALADAQAWTARIALWNKSGVESSFDVPQTTVIVEVIKEYWVGDTIAVVKVKAPVDGGSQKAGQ